MEMQTIMNTVEIVRLLITHSVKAFHICKLILVKPKSLGRNKKKVNVCCSDLLSSRIDRSTKMFGWPQWFPLVTYVLMKSRIGDKNKRRCSKSIWDETSFFKSSNEIRYIVNSIKVHSECTRYYNLLCF